jgi:hypothetical protein
MYKNTFFLNELLSPSSIMNVGEEKKNQEKKEPKKQKLGDFLKKCLVCPKALTKKSHLSCDTA